MVINDSWKFLQFKDSYGRMNFNLTIPNVLKSCFINSISLMK